jgi:hypothetical protein
MTTLDRQRAEFKEMENEEIRFLAGDVSEIEDHNVA